MWTIKALRILTLHWIEGHTIKRCSELKTGTEAAEEADRAGIWGGPATSAPESLGW